jgi:hypothetical protein
MGARARTSCPKLRVGAMAEVQGSAGPQVNANILHPHFERISACVDRLGIPARTWAQRYSASVGQGRKFLKHKSQVAFRVG